MDFFLLIFLHKNVLPMDFFPPSQLLSFFLLRMCTKTCKGFIEWKLFKSLLYVSNGLYIFIEFRMKIHRLVWLKVHKSWRFHIKKLHGSTFHYKWIKNFLRNLTIHKKDYFLIINSTNVSVPMLVIALKQLCAFYNYEGIKTTLLRHNIIVCIPPFNHVNVVA